VRRRRCVGRGARRRRGQLWPAALALLACAACGDTGDSPSRTELPRVATMSLVTLPEAEAATEAAGDEGDGASTGTSTGTGAIAASRPSSDEGAVEGRPEGEAPPATPPTPTEMRPVFDLADNRLLAHWYRDGGLHIVAGSAGFSRYAQPGRRSSGWRLREREGRVPVARLRGSATATVPLDEDAAKQAASLTLGLHSSRRARLSVAVNNRAAREVDLGPGWQNVSVPVAGSWRAGENGIRLALRGTSEVALAWMRIGGGSRDFEKAARAVDPASAGDPDPHRALSFHDPSDGSLRLTARDQLVYYIHVPEYAVLAGEVVGEGPDAAACRVSVRVRAHLAAIDGELGPERTRIDLDALAGQVARVRFDLRGCARARLKGGALLVPGAAPARRTGPPPRHVILWIMDTLRADRIRPIRPGARPEVPALERLAAEGATFRQAYVQGNESNTSHASVWTSLFPAVHGVRTAGNGGTWRLSSRFTTMGDLARKAGMYATGVTANGMITPAGGYARGFSSFINMMREGHPGRLNAWIPGEKILDRALGTMKGREKQPFFLFVGTIDTHKPWIGHEPWLSQYDPEEYEGPFEFAARARDLGIKRGSMRCTQTPSERDLARINAIYDSAVSYQDSVLGKMLSKLDEWGISDQTMIIVTADHGEELWEDGRCGHGASLRDTLLHVPLLVRYPPLIPPGTVVEEGVDGLDLLPTVAEALGQDPPSPGQGASLLPLAQGIGRGYARPSYASQYEYAHAMRVATWKIWLTRKGGLMLYDLANDPAERASIGSRPIEARFMIDLLYLFLAHREEWNKREWGVVNNMTAAAPIALERLAGARTRAP
jgi:arylsulfatase A-like enzyme